MPDPAEPAARKKPGPKPRTDWQATYLDEMEKNCLSGLACKRANVNEATVRRERRRNPDFAIAEGDARERSLDALEAILRMRGTTGQPVKKTVTKYDKEGNVIETTETTELVISTSAAFFLLKRYRPEFRESFRVENTGPDGGPVQHEHSVDGALEDLYAELDRIAAAASST